MSRDPSARRVICPACQWQSFRIDAGTCTRCGAAMLTQTSAVNSLTDKRREKARRELREQEGTPSKR